MENIQNVAAAITAAAATVSPYSPLPAKLCALVSDASIGFLFAAGILPGLLIGLMMAGTNAYITEQNFLSRNLPFVIFPNLGCTSALMLPVILLGGIYGGVTPLKQPLLPLLPLLVSVFLSSVSFDFLWALRIARDQQPPLEH